MRSNTTFFNNSTDGRFGFTFANQSSGGVLGTIGRHPHKWGTTQCKFMVLTHNRIDNYKDHVKILDTMLEAVKFAKHRSPQIARRLNHYK